MIEIGDDGDPVLAGVPDSGKKIIVSLGPGLHIHPAVIQRINRGQAGLKLAENHAIFDEAVMAPVIFQGQISPPESPVACA